MHLSSLLRCIRQPAFDFTKLEYGSDLLRVGSRAAECCEVRRPAAMEHQLHRLSRCRTCCTELKLQHRICKFGQEMVVCMCTLNFAPLSLHTHGDAGSCGYSARGLTTMELERGTFAERISPHVPHSELVAVDLRAQSHSIIGRLGAY